MNQKTAKLIRRFAKSNFDNSKGEKIRVLVKRIKKTYNTQTDAQRAKIKSEMRLAISAAKEKV